MAAGWVRDGRADSVGPAGSGRSGREGPVGSGLGESGTGSGGFRSVQDRAGRGLGKFGAGRGI